MKSLFKLGMWSAAVLGVITLGCQHGPKLTKEQAVALIQAEYDHEAPVSAIIQVNDAGMKEGVIAKYWDRSKAYPNHVWADFKLTDTGKKLVKLPDGGDTILWHPDSPTDMRYKITLSLVAANHLKAEDASEPQKVAGGSEQMVYEEVTRLQGVPEPVQDMARDSHTRVAAPRTANFVIDNGGWKLQSIQ